VILHPWNDFILNENDDLNNLRRIILMLSIALVEGPGLKNEKIHGINLPTANF
jgi:hypothetical protein